MENLKFQIQVGKGNSSYKTIYSFENEEQAMLYYQSLNVHSGYKKRFLDDGKIIFRTLTTTF
jgi:hypothetical protein